MESSIISSRAVDVLLALATTDCNNKINSWRIEDQLGISGKQLRSVINYLRVEGEPMSGSWPISGSVQSSDYC